MIDGIMFSSFYITKIFFKVTIAAHVTFWIDIVTTLTSPVIFGLLIRFERVQVQLRAQEENTIKILKTIKRAKILEMAFILTLIVTTICFAIGNYGTEVFNISTKTAQVLDIIA